MKTSFLLSLSLCLFATASPLPRQQDTRRRDQNLNRLNPDTNDPALVPVRDARAPLEDNDLIAVFRDQGLPTTADRPALPRLRSISENIAGLSEGRTTLPSRRVQQLQFNSLYHEYVPRFERLASNTGRSNPVTRGASRLAPSTLGAGVTEAANVLAHVRF